MLTEVRISDYNSWGERNTHNIVEHNFKNILSPINNKEE